jgi:hypothetical protein
MESVLEDKPFTAYAVEVVWVDSVCGLAQPWRGGLNFMLGTAPSLLYGTQYTLASVSLAY